MFYSVMYFRDFSNTAKFCYDTIWLNMLLHTQQQIWKKNFELTRGTTYLILTGKLQDVFCWENQICYNMDHVQSSPSPKPRLKPWFGAGTWLHITDFILWLPAQLGYIHYQSTIQYAGQVPRNRYRNGGEIKVHGMTSYSGF